MSASDDDWETADLAPVKSAKPLNASASLRAAAPSFQPKPARPPPFSPPSSADRDTPSPSVTHTTLQRNAEAGPSRPRMLPRDSSMDPGDLDTRMSGLKLASRQLQTEAFPALGSASSTRASDASHANQGAKSVWTTTNAPRSSRSGQASPVRQASAGEDDQDAWFRDARPVTNRQIWDTAYFTIHITITLMNSNNQSRPTILSPQLAVPTPGVTILRRSAATGSPNETGKKSGTQTPPKTIEEREEEYRLARERIFGSGGGGGGGAGGGSGGSNRASPAPSPQLQPTRTNDISTSGSSSFHGQISNQHRNTSAPLSSNTPSSRNNETLAVPRNKSGEGRSRAGGNVSHPAESTKNKKNARSGSGETSAGAPIYLAAPLPGQGQGIERREEKVPQGLLRNPRGPGEGPGFGAGFGR